MHCLFCHSPQITKTSFPRPTHFNGNSFDYYKCNDCGLVFINPLPSNDDYAKMYARSYHEQFYFKEEVPDYNDLYTLLEQNTTERSIVDYGCGDGSLLQFFSGMGYKCTGVEFDPHLVALLKEKFPGIEFYTVSEFNNLDCEVRFGNIYMGDVFEHLTNPDQFLHSLTLRLNGKGGILVQGPLENNLTLALIFRKLVSWFKFGKAAAHTPYHIIFSNSNNQKAIFEKNGFATLHYSIYETPWPLPEKFTLKPVSFFKWTIARISMFFSKIIPGKLGNRFIYFGQPKNK